MLTYPIGNGQGPVVICLCSEGEDISALARRLEDTCNGTLAAFPVSDWNSDLTPWPAPGAFGRGDFGGRGADTLAKLLEAAQALSGQTLYLAGYSLGGLFALWALLESDCFSGCASCSGSLWYPGWEDYLAKKALPGNAHIYLSLGTHEERTRNPVMCRVGGSTRALAAMLEEKGIPHRLEWNPGGHFRDADARLEKGIRWLFAHHNVA